MPGEENVGNHQVTRRHDNAANHNRESNSEYEEKGLRRGKQKERQQLIVVAIKCTSLTNNDSYLT